MHPTLMHESRGMSRWTGFATRSRHALPTRSETASEMPQRRFRLMAGIRVAVLGRSVFSR